MDFKIGEEKFTIKVRVLSALNLRKRPKDMFPPYVGHLSRCKLDLGYLCEDKQKTNSKNSPLISFQEVELQALNEEEDGEIVEGRNLAMIDAGEDEESDLDYDDEEDGVSESDSSAGEDEVAVLGNEVALFSETRDELRPLLEPILWNKELQRMGCFETTHGRENVFNEPKYDSVKLAILEVSTHGLDNKYCVSLNKSFFTFKSGLGCFNSGPINFTGVPLTLVKYCGPVQRVSADGLGKINIEKKSRVPKVYNRKRKIGKFSVKDSDLFLKGEIRQGISQDINRFHEGESSKGSKLVLWQDDNEEVEEDASYDAVLDVNCKSSMLPGQIRDSIECEVEDVADEFDDLEGNNVDFLAGDQDYFEPKIDDLMREKDDDIEETEEYLSEQEVPVDPFHGINALFADGTANEKEDALEEIVQVPETQFTLTQGEPIKSNNNEVLKIVTDNVVEGSNASEDWQKILKTAADMGVEVVSLKSKKSKCFNKNSKNGEPSVKISAEKGERELKKLEWSVNYGGRNKRQVVDGTNLVHQ